MSSLRSHAAASGIVYGCAVATQLLGQDPAYEQLVQEQCGIVVAENAMKWGPLRPRPTEFSFAEADRFFRFAESNHMLVRGHNLCWHRQLPGWFAAVAKKENIGQLLTEHIRTVAGRYKGRVQSWDVVNEAIAPKDGRLDGLRKSIWLELMGPEYIDLAFRTAREADPKARLTYNDYGIEGEDEESSAKRRAVLDLVRGLKARGVPLDAVGVQSHIGAGGQFGAGLVSFLAALRALKLEIYVTEMDVNDRKLPADPGVRDVAVAKTYREYLDLVLREPAVKSVLTWGITDAETWLNGEDAREDHLPERCLPFDRELKPVAAFSAIRTAFDERPGR